MPAISKMFLVVLSFVILFSGPAVARPVAPGANGPATFADLAESRLPAVVNISSTQKIEQAADMPDMPQFPPGSPFEDFFEEFMGRQGEGFPVMPATSLGSGFIIDADKGYIVTNAHVIKDAEEVRVTFSDDTTQEAEVIGRDEKMDLAVLKVDMDKNRVAVPFGDSDVLRVGDWVMAIGNPFGLGGTVTAGIVSARQRDIHAGPYDDFIQTDASINSGNSGGPMFNLSGEVIGINTAIFSPSGGSVGIGFAIPSALAKPVINQLIEFGHTRRGWLGVRIQSVTEEISENLGLEEVRGALVASVTPDSPAIDAGLEPGDVILSFDGKPVDEMRHLPRIVAETPINKKVGLTYWRDGKKRKTSVVVGELEKAEKDGLLASVTDKKVDESDEVTREDLGLTFGAMTTDLRSTYDLDEDTNGVVVTAVASMSNAAEKGVLPGDVIVEVNQKVVNEPKEVAKLIDEAQKSGRSSVLFLMDRGGDMRFVALKFKKK